MRYYFRYPAGKTQFFLPMHSQYSNFYCLQNLEFIGARPAAPAIDAWFARVNALDGVRAALPEPFLARMPAAA